MTVTAGKTYPIPGPWQGGQSCTGRVTPGAAALLAWMLANRPAPPERSMGIYNCRTVVGGSATSLHAEGRALDWGVFPLAADGTGTDAGHELVDLLLSSADLLGIQCVIYDRTIWSARSPGGRRYTGRHPHYDHLHIELQWEQARTLTLNRLVEVLGGTAEKPGDIPDPEQETPKPPPPPEPEPPAPPAPQPDEVVELMKRVDLSGVTRQRSTFVRGPEVAVLQAGLLANGYGPHGLVNSQGRPDGVGGPATRRLLGEAQTRFRTGFPSNPSRPDFVAGRGTYEALFVK